MTHTTLHIDASARRHNSTTRDLSDQILHHLTPGPVIRRDLADPLPQITEDWVSANFTPPDQRDAVQRDVLALSDQLVDELQRADTLVIGLPIYNFSVPASFKAWIDLIARVGVTFAYTSDGPRGLLTGKRAIVAIASGGTTLGSGIDFASDYVRHILGFVGITDITFVPADTTAVDPDSAMSAATSALENLAA